MLASPVAGRPPFLDYRIQAEAHSLLNTPPVFAIYAVLLVTRWLLEEIGGVAAMARINRQKADLLYGVLDRSEGFYRGRALARDRSLMNVPFNLESAELEHRFLDEALAAGLHGLGGHRSLGGIRASLYNAVELPAVERLAEFMEEFQRINRRRRPPSAETRPHSHRRVAELPLDVATTLDSLTDAGSWQELELASRAATLDFPDAAAGWRALGRALARLETWSGALDALKRLVALVPAEASAHNDLGYAQYRLGREEEGEASYRRALECDPQLARAHDNLGALLGDLGRVGEAAGHLRKSLEIEPEGSFPWLGLGTLMGRVGTMDEAAIGCLERYLAVRPGDADARTLLGNLLLRTGQQRKSLEMFRLARQLRPLITWRARNEAASFSVLLLIAPGFGLTPIDYLVRKSAYDCHFYCVLPEAEHPVELLRQAGRVVVNTIADADCDRDLLPVAVELVEQLGLPTVNPPGRIAGTDRESVARRLQGIPHCRMPATVRLRGTDLAATLVSGSPAGIDFPILVRVPGTHGGDLFERCSDAESLIGFTDAAPGEDYYLTEYVDYRSEDGFFRKYRFICVGGELLPYHLAIHDDWKVHHFRTDMPNQEWMRVEEEGFLSAPHLVFGPPQLAALQSVVTVMGLDYFGIDCALDRVGNVVIFETNGVMLVHDEKDPAFAYKNPFIERIKERFDALLSRLAGCQSD
jgi:tetratricopeptide (TPR) repeat protein